MIRIFRPIPVERLKLLVFDLDGTLIDSAQDLCNSVNATLAHFGHPPLTDETIANFIGDGALMLMRRAMTEAYGINNAGQIVGSYENRYLVSQGFIDTNGTFTTVEDPLGTEGSWADGINSNGDIVGYYEDSSGNDHGFLATPDGTSTDGAPLPVSGGTLPGAAVLLGWLARRLATRRKAQPNHLQPAAA